MILARAGQAFARWARAWIPDPLVFAVALTAVTFAAAWLLTPHGPQAIVEAWIGPGGFFNLLAFSMQMSLILVTGHALAASPPLAGLLSALARWPRGPRQATALVALVAVAAGLVNWGLGLIAGALLAREMGRSSASRGLKAHYPLLGAAGYTGLLVWHGGFSGSAPLTVTRMADLEQVLGSGLAHRVGVMGLEQTLLSPMNLTVAAALMVVVPGVCALILPEPDACQGIDEFEAAGPAAAAPAVTRTPRGVAERLEQSRLVALALATLMAAAAAVMLSKTGLLRVHLNTVILLMFCLGILLHGHLRSYLAAVSEAIKGTAGIVIQFPLYGGIMGVMSGTGLVALMARAMVSVSTARTFPLFNFFSASVVNLFVPSGGGQWAVQGPISVQAALDLGVPAPLAVMSLAYGDQCTNMLQPFWALPLLGITGLKAHDVVGYTAFIMLCAVPVFALALLAFR